jgi:hypothetical protein
MKLKSTIFPKVIGFSLKGRVKAVGWQKRKANGTLSVLIRTVKNTKKTSADAEVKTFRGFLKN